MKLTVGIIAGITLSILVYILGARTLAWLLCRVEVYTPLDYSPKMRTWIRGELQP